MSKFVSLEPLFNELRITEENADGESSTRDLSILEIDRFKNLLRAEGGVQRRIDSDGSFAEDEFRSVMGVENYEGKARIAQALNGSKSPFQEKNGAFGFTVPDDAPNTDIDVVKAFIRDAVFPEYLRHAAAGGALSQQYIGESEIFDNVSYSRGLFTMYVWAPDVMDDMLNPARFEKYYYPRIKSTILEADDSPERQHLLEALDVEREHAVQLQKNPLLVYRLTHFSGEREDSFVSLDQFAQRMTRQGIPMNASYGNDAAKSFLPEEKERAQAIMARIREQRGPGAVPLYLTFASAIDFYDEGVHNPRRWNDNIKGWANRAVRAYDASLVDAVNSEIYTPDMLAQREALRVIKRYAPIAPTENGLSEDIIRALEEPQGLLEGGKKFKPAALERQANIEKLCDPYAANDPASRHIKQLYARWESSMKPYDLPPVALQHMGAQLAYDPSSKSLQAPKTFAVDDVAMNVLQQATMRNALNEAASVDGFIAWVDALPVEKAVKQQLKEARANISGAALAVLHMSNSVSQTVTQEDTNETALAKLVDRTPMADDWKIKAKQALNSLQNFTDENNSTLYASSKRHLDSKFKERFAPNEAALAKAMSTLAEHGIDLEATMRMLALEDAIAKKPIHELPEVPDRAAPRLEVKPSRRI